MFSSVVINLVIFLSFTYFIASLMLSTINEAFASFINARASLLKKTLVHLFNDPEWAAYIENTFYQSLHIQALQKDAKKLPSYIPGDNFILTLIDNIGSANYEPALIQKGIDNSSLPPSIKKVLLDLWVKSHSDIEETMQNPMKAFETELTKYYNNAMDRASGIYKRKTRNMIWILGLALCIIFNIDTIELSNNALNNTGQLDAAAGKITAAIARMHPPANTTDSTQKDAAAFQGRQADSIAIAFQEAKDSVSSLQAQYENTTGYHLGYKGSFEQEWGFSKKQGLQPHSFLLKLLGILLTSFALQLGSTYWFEVLNKFANLRATGKKPEGAA